MANVAARKAAPMTAEPSLMADLYTSLSQAVGIIRAYVPKDALGHDCTGDADVPGGMYSWPVLEEQLYYMDAVLARACGESDRVSQQKCQLVPVKATEAMLAAGDSAIPRAEAALDGTRMMGREVALECWRAMLDAAPKPQAVWKPAPPEEEERRYKAALADANLFKSISEPVS